ncbi:MAG: C10 family peptidase [Bacteroidia bacterium]|nr:C10 family peptidase [Bacteroidia bacterium]
MFKKFLFISLLALSGISLFAKPVSMEYAKAIASKWYMHCASARTSDFSVKDQFETKYMGLTTYYTFIFNAGGFVMIAADDAVMPVLGYSDDSPFDKNNIPQNAREWFDTYSKDIKHIVDSRLDNTETLAEWNKINNENFEKDAQAIIGPFCTTTWDQSPYYNALCPGGSVTGCVATAMAQIMKKWNYPTTGNGSHSYTPYSHPEYGVQTANFGATTYNWTSMPNSIYSSNTAIATLMFHCGVSVDMDYDPNGSGASPTAVPGAYVNYFRYQPTAECKYRAFFTNNADWTTLIKTELDATRPVFYAGDDNATAGHAFVCDGYNSTTNKYHFNWGWSGFSDGYFYLTSLNPSGNDFNYNNVIVIRIRPLAANVPIANFAASTTTPPVSTPVTFTDQSLNSPTTWSWTFQGGTPSTSNAQNPPDVTFAVNGYKIITLTVSNANGSDTKTMEHYVNVGGAPSAWIKQNTAFSAASRGIDQIFIVDQNTVWAKAYDGVNPSGYIREFTKTINGGTTWTPGNITFTNSTSYGAANIFAFSSTVAFAAMFPTTANGGMVVKTTDGGATWSTANSPDFSASWLDFIHFFNANEGVCVGDPNGTEFVIYTTSNGGNSWTIVPGANIPNAVSGEAAIVDFYDAAGDNIWFGTGGTSVQGRVFKSTDKGHTWTVSSLNMGTNVQINLAFKDANAGFAIGSASPYPVKKTIDGGATWTTYNPTGYYVKMPDFAYVPGTSAMWVDVSSGPNYGSSYSLDDGASWINIDTGSVQYTAVAFLDENTGWAGGFNTNSVDGGIYKWDPSVMIGIKNTTDISNGNITVFPVPAKNFVNIKLGKIEDENLSVVIYNMIGQPVVSKQMKTVSNDIIQLDLSGKEAGFYFINITNGSRTITKKVTIVK